jgi:hypothetical protein
MFNDDSRTGAGNLLTFFFGIAVGVAGTFIYAAANEDQFRRAVGRTRALADKAQDSVGDYIEDAGDRVKSVGDKAQGQYEKVVSKVKGKAADVAEDVEHSARQAKRELNS